MGRKMWAILLGVTLIFGGILWTQWRTENKEKITRREVSKPVTTQSVSPEPSPVPPAPSHAATPAPVPDSQSIPVRATWLEFAEPVEGVSITLSPKDVPRKGETPLPSLTGVRDKAGRVALALPADTPLPSRLQVQVRADGPGIAPLFIESARVYTTQTLELFLNKAYDFHGTVYWDPKGTGMVPAPGAQ
ncbi:MAG TPA: hypothetical protein PLA90_11745, partial [Candidatus Sumerlaeota bacterium]|nr:hypothetical protein [Candidatus Sumerlaeota bacterium]